MEPYVPKKLTNTQKQISQQSGENIGNSDTQTANHIMENNVENRGENNGDGDHYTRTLQKDNSKVTETSETNDGGTEQRALEEITLDGVNGKPHVETPLLNPLSSPVPSDWVTIEDDFIFLLVSYQSHISDEMCMDPHGELNDGVMSMGFVRNNQPGVRKRLINMMLSMGDGSHLNDPGYEVVKVRAFRLEPLNESGGHLCVDGEEVQYGPIQAQVLHGMARVMAKHKVPRKI